jgi:protein ImuB
MSALSSRRYLALWLRRLSTDRIERRLPGPADGPRVVIAAIQQAQRIVALNDAAAALGVKRDMALADARARYPSLPVAEADTEADRRLLEAIADWCDRYTPLVGLDPPDGLVLDITGCAHLFGGEAALARDLVTRLASQGFAACAAVADTVGCAWALARYGSAGAFVAEDSPMLPRHNRRSPSPQGERTQSTAAAVPVAIISSDGTEAAMLPLPIAALRIDADAVDALAVVGLKSVGDLAARPRASFVARFGERLLHRLDQALGRQDEPITPRLPVPLAMVEQRFAEPIAREADVLGTIEHLAQQLAIVLERRGEGARLIQLALFRTDGAVHRLEIGTGAPLRDPVRIRKLFEDRLATLGDACDPGFGYDVIRLSALVNERSDPAQTGFGSADHAEELAHLIDRLGARFGLRRVLRLVPQDTHIPEYAVAAVPAHAVSSSSLLGEGVAPTRAEEKGSHRQDSLFPTRPIRLFERPEPVEATAQVPDGPPIVFRWRQVRHQVVHAEGPERIALEWWRDEARHRLTRDYFRVESSAGVRVWLYREGLYGRETAQPRWYLHGLFA